MLLNQPPPAQHPLLLLTHGAGASVQHEFFSSFKETFARLSISLAGFNFKYMEQNVEQNRRSPPPRFPKLIEEYREMIDSIDHHKIWIGGKSMGGRVATCLVDHPKVRGVIVLGYPFHPPKKPNVLRVDHLQHFSKPCLICQGERDTFGNHKEIMNYSLDPNIEFHWVNDGDHSFKPRKSSGCTQQENINLAAKKTAEFIQRFS